ncbi:SGNH/GDSL hydrolase family protein [Cupriavidus sp. AU9028]|uniref:SGNH/GDSL hydrolase family protein n=1 Tax=Cupriavidus sp. AU9028 TaxID=2871157 RepID=UPI001C972C67|nr:SGNH/GDSL hydrolase family protein [Cupriavidus sp. AU9028]MBY4895439.1 SGNH/GDSL hydrolase family protein [Cupriavidus sp. AU9028]
MKVSRRVAGSLLVLGVAAVLGTEVFARAALGLGDPPLYQADPEIEYLLQPNQNVRRFGHLYHVNQYSMRSADFPAAPQAGERRVLVFGDSVVNGGARVDQTRLATEQVRNRLGGAGGPATVGNVAAFSWGPGNWLAYARRHGFFGADTVIVVVNAADYGDVPTFAPLDPDTHPSRRPISALVEGATRYLPEFLGLDSAAPLPPPAVREQDREASLRDFDELLAMAQAAGVKVRLVQHFQRHELDAPETPAGLQAFARLCEQRQIPVVSLRDAEARSRDIAYLDEIHLTEAGQDILAEGLMTALDDSVTQLSAMR